MGFLFWGKKAPEETIRHEMAKIEMEQRHILKIQEEVRREKEAEKRKHPERAAQLDADIASVEADAKTKIENLNGKLRKLSAEL